jgi:hypothetical protein
MKAGLKQEIRKPEMNYHGLANKILPELRLHHPGRISLSCN